MIERIIRLFVFTLFIVSCKSYAQLPEYITSLEEVETQFGRNTVINYYATENPSSGEHSTRTVESMGLDKDYLHLVFHSEVDDEFSFYINGVLVKKAFEDTRIKTPGTTKQTIFEFAYPQGQSKATLRVTSLKYGGFETEIRKSFPMLYVKYRDNKWSLVHNNLFIIKGYGFLKD